MGEGESGRGEAEGWAGGGGGKTNLVPGRTVLKEDGGGRGGLTGGGVSDFEWVWKGGEGGGMEKEEGGGAGREGGGGRGREKGVGEVDSEDLEVEV